MKVLNLLLLLTLFAPGAARADESDDDQPQYCSAELELLDGTVQTARVECDSPYAGKCLKETYTDSSQRHTQWREVECK
jgi:hypothetical protein